MANSADPDSSEANWSGPTLFAKGMACPGSAGRGLILLHYMKLYFYTQSHDSGWVLCLQAGCPSVHLSNFSVH